MARRWLNLLLVQLFHLLPHQQLQVLEWPLGSLHLGFVFPACLLLLVHLLLRLQHLEAWLWQYQQPL